MICVELRGPGGASVRAAAALSCFLTFVACGGGGRPLAEETVGATVRRLAEGLSHPRWLHVLPNGDVLAAESITLPAEPNSLTERIGFYLARGDGSRGQSADTIVLLRDADGDGVVETRTAFLRGTVKQPFGMALIGDRFFVAGTGGVWQFTYRDGDTVLSGEGRKILDLPVGGYNHHWTRNILARQDGQKLYVTVGSVSDFGEGDADSRRLANVLEINPDGSGERIFTSGIRNPNGLAFEPETGVLWTVVPERDMLGDDLVPDYLTRVRDGDFYGWPWSYWGTHIDERVTPPNPAMAAKAITPDYSLGAHTTPLGLVFYTASRFPCSGQERKPAGGRRHGWHHLAGDAGSGRRRVEMTQRRTPRAEVWSAASGESPVRARRDDRRRTSPTRGCPAARASG